MQRVLLIVLVLGLFVGNVFAQEAGQINGVVADSSGGVIPGVTVYRRRKRHRHFARHRDAAPTGAIQFVVDAADHLRDSAPSLRGSEPCAARMSLLQANQNLTLNITIELGELSRNGHRGGRSRNGRRQQRNDLRSRRLEADRRAAAERPRCGAAQHARAGHGRHGGRSGVRENDSRRACVFRPTAPSRGRRRSGWTARTTPIRTSSRISRSRSLTRCRSSAFRPATTAPPRAPAPARSSTR